uniref:Putative secreted protein n=1 Tax=Ixodes scapularis TaxID=6945 RepID=A0A4D5RDP8_IXOSC
MKSTNDVWAAAALNTSVMAVSAWSAPMTASTAASARLASTANVTDVAFAKAAAEFLRTQDARRPSAKALHGSQPQ